MSVHTSAACGFQRAADAYERGRPEYPQAALEWLRDRFDLRAGRTVVDVGAGTGKLTRAVAATGASVVAVEPVAAMRSVLEREVPSAHVLEGTAEALPLTDASVDVILAAAAFHWFDGRQALAEFHRVLRPGGGLGLMWNRRPREDELHTAINEIIDPYRGETPSHVAGAWRVALDETNLFVSNGEMATAFEQVFDLERFVDRVGSISFIAALDEQQRADVLERIRAVGKSRVGPIQLSYTCDVQAYRRS